MPNDELTASELTALVQRVFAPRPEERTLAILVDLPDSALPDRPSWALRRELAAGWARELQGAAGEHGLEVDLYLYRNVRTNNAELPSRMWRHQGGALPPDAEGLAGEGEPTEEVLALHAMVLAPTQLSATAPLKMLAKRLGCRAATMPGFSPEMVPALRLDYDEVNRRVMLLKGLLDRATEARLRFMVDADETHDLLLDLRHRTAHASGGRLPEPGTAGNLPSGEAYIVPYEGEVDGDATRSAGTLPVQLGDEVVLFRVVANRAVEILSGGAASAREADLLATEPARGNVAELGLGVLAELGVEPVGEVLLDEKLGLHVAFGRSDHFGGQVGPAQFSSPEAVIHQDHVYIERLQPRVVAAAVDLELTDGTTMALIRDGRYVVRF
jgi:hypothetical protein